MNPNRQITTTIKEQRKRDKKQREQGAKQAMSVLNLVPLLALRDEYGFGKKRMIRYILKYQDMIDAYNKGYITLVDIAKTLDDEVGITLDHFILK